jgi:hypothetical protein
VRWLWTLTGGDPLTFDLLVIFKSQLLGGGEWEDWDRFEARAHEHVVHSTDNLLCDC